jgi:hypothetical protein
MQARRRACTDPVDADRLADLRLDHLYVLYPGDKTYALDRKVEVVRLATFVKAE